jgi:hypothetical protein
MSELDRRRFNELSAAALAGLAAGTLAGCGDGSPKRQPVGKGTQVTVEGDRHLCRGLNDCRGQGRSGNNECRGQGDCATLAEHSCGGQNECKGQGGCGENPGLNECKGHGGCSVPLMDAAWDKVRERKVAAWTNANEKYGVAPAKTMN